MQSLLRYIFSPLLAVVMIFLQLASTAAAANEELFKETINNLSSHKSRITGSEGYNSAADYVEQQFIRLGLEPSNHYFSVPVRTVESAHIEINNTRHNLSPFIYNAITPGATDGALSGPLYYVGSGGVESLNNKIIAGSILLMEFDSGRNWQQLASLGAKALIYIDRGTTKSKSFFKEKHELSPVQFPCFWMDESTAQTIFGVKLDATQSTVAPTVTIEAVVHWENVQARNIYTRIPGANDDLKEELLIIEAFFDTDEYVVGRSPGADSAVSIATLLQIAADLVEAPPQRTVMLIASGGHAQSLAGMRDLMWSVNTSAKELRNLRRTLQKELKIIEKQTVTLANLEFPLEEDPVRDKKIASSINQSLKYEIDKISRELMQLRLAGDDKQYKDQIDIAAEQRFALRRLGWAESYHNRPPDEAALFKKLIPVALEENRLLLTEMKQQFKELKSTNAFRQTVKEYEVAAVISLHLSSHGDGIGGFHRGWLYKLKPTINRTGIFSNVAEILSKTASTSDISYPYRETLRPGGLRSWDSWLADKPQLGGEISSLAGFIGISLATTGDSRPLWGTPWDTADQVDYANARQQALLATDLIRALSFAPKLNTGKFPRDGLASASGRTNLLLQGELFADYPAAGTTILAYQGLNRFYATVDRHGRFFIRGIADKKNVLDKLIIEGYKFDNVTGRVNWAIDKQETGKSNYRLKMLRKSMKTDLVMFSCKETTVFDLLEPRNFNYMTKLQLYDGRRDASPQHYWYSRIDTRKSNISSVYLEPGARLKMTLSDTVLTRKMLLTNAKAEKPMGVGYPVNSYNALYNTTFLAADDAWNLLGPRIKNLESHGIFDEKIHSLKERGLTALKTSRDAFSALNYSTAREAAAEALALASRVYVQVEKTQKDVLFGVLFYIALFIPFAFCMERFLFNFASIYKRILGFSLILFVLIAIIYQVHPAFQLTYSPMVVILAFFIIGLSLMVTLIIFFRFEEEMALLQQKASHKRPDEISRWKAFLAAFFLGVSNLRRRRLRTILTCSTLIILTFTIMSFTTIKSNRQENRLLFQQTAPYAGLLLKNLNWQSLPTQATDILINSMQTIERPAPRIWLESDTPSDTIAAPVSSKNGREVLQGLIGLSANEPYVTGLDSILTAGRWFKEEDRHAIILEEQMANRLGVDPNNDNQVFLWGEEYTVIGLFNSQTLDTTVDLDGEPLTPVTFPEEAGTEMSEAEQEALESGEDIRSIQSRYRHIPGSQIAIVPAQTLQAAGGNLKNVAVRPDDPSSLRDIASQLTDRFSLVIFTGEHDGVWLYNVSDTLNYSGVPNILIPLLISILIVLNTMISSVYERKGEIAVYTSVGLAPSHVAFLFVAEALALAVISVVIGYVIAQVSAALFSSTRLWDGITVNYSSMAGVAAMLLVILVVLVSVIYPAKVAARIAIPDVNRTFTLPKPVNNSITVTLPFLMKYQENESIAGFIYQYFTGHQDISHGVFSTGPVDVIFSCSTVDEISKLLRNANTSDDLHCLHLRANVWLAPFDFGIMQTVDVQFCPAQEGKDYLSIKVTLNRKSGEAGIWHRINTVFLHEFRKQLLIWRSLDDATHHELTEAFKKVAAPNIVNQETV
ncbi:FtsX-like permease family protein [Desulfosediminicola flagellatus]|uniref:FtsX-like permease family protein n=1 Tax=Desulfosediminicola flagellatus TaxID=2569541 RepID=UPI0010ACE7D0|nr:ABC transporter permease [Desulfosediminicola flagellatus]